MTSRKVEGFCIASVREVGLSSIAVMSGWIVAYVDVGNNICIRLSIAHPSCRSTISHVSLTVIHLQITTSSVDVTSTEIAVPRCTHRLRVPAHAAASLSWTTPTGPADGCDWLRWRRRGGKIRETSLLGDQLSYSYWQWLRSLAVTGRWARGNTISLVRLHAYVSPSSAR